MTHVVWFKRDLRVHDHAPLAEAARAGPVVPLYIAEPGLWAQPDASARQWAFLREALADLDAALQARGTRLIVRVGDAVAVLADLHARHPLTALWSHEETGNGWTYARDLKVGAWAREADIPWHERRQFGVIRRLRDRSGWAKRWDGQMRRPAGAAPARFAAGPDLDPGTPPTAEALGLASDPCPGRQPGGRTTGLALLDGFLTARGAAYHRDMSSPVTAYDRCSRLSPHLAAGTVSMRETAQATWARQIAVRALDRAEGRTWRGALNAYAGRLHWHCHFMQKLEDAPAHEFTNVHSGYDGLRTAPDPARLAAWAEGRTGLPFVDACMRALAATGWLNFRMRAMVMAVASYHLWLPWRDSGLVLARLFTDYEPGIHWNQVQMQSGTTGINTVRIYNPVKQSHDQDPDGVFIRAWVPELAAVPTAHVHEPWRLSPLERADLNLIYPDPIVDHLAAAKAARAAMYAVRRDPAFRAEADAIQAKHGSRKSGIPHRGGRRRAPQPESGASQMTLDV